MSTTLRALRDDEFPAYVQTSKAEYAADMVEHGGLPPETAREKAEADYARLFPHGPATEGIHLRVVEHDGVRVGHVLFAEREQHGRRAVWLYEIRIDDDVRGRGHGRRAMELVEAETRALGLARIELNVFGGNAVARGLYASLGFREVAVVMEKELG